MKQSCREEINEYINKFYKAQPEYLWQHYPDACIYRHDDNRKWFALIMIIARDRLGLEGSERVEILNLKLSDPFSAELMIQNDGFFKAYHMGSGSSWITVILDGTVPPEQIYPLIDESFSVTSSKKKRNKARPPKEWIIPANPKYYDVQSDVDSRDTIEWKQGAGIKCGDTVYMYVGAPVSAILYKFTVVETDIPYDRKNENVNIRSLMRIKLERRYDPDRFTFDTLKREFGIFAVRGPRFVPNSLNVALND